MSIQKVEEICGLGIYDYNLTADYVVKKIKDCIQAVELATEYEAVILPSKSPFIWSEGPHRFVVAFKGRDTENRVKLYYTQGLVDLLAENNVWLLNAIEQHIRSGYPNNVQIGSQRAEYLAEEVYLAYCRKYDYADGVISFLNNIVTHRFGGNCDNEKMSVLKSMISKIENEEAHSRNKGELERLKELLSMQIQYDDSTIGRAGDTVLLLDKKMPLYVVGDTHGDSISVRSIIEEIKFCERAEQMYTVFLGDLVNNGLKSLENLIYILSLQEAHRSNLVILSGNHEVRETLLTALTEYYHTHWNNSRMNKLCGKLPPFHYGHIRLDLMMRFGVEDGEELYRLFGNWGRGLPYIVFSDKKVMISHSLGLLGQEAKISFAALACAKAEDEPNFRTQGYEAWRKSKGTLYACMANNGKIEPELLVNMQKSIIAPRHIGSPNVFVVGHRHFRSGDIHHSGKMSAIDIKAEGRFVTICSSHKISEEAGHYMHEQYGRARLEKEAEEGREKETGPYYVKFGEDEVKMINRKRNLFSVKLQSR